MIAMAAGGCYYLTLATRNPDKRRWYLWSGVYLALGSLIRYENWIILFAAVPLLIYSFARRRFAWDGDGLLGRGWKAPSSTGVIGHSLESQPGSHGTC